MRVAHGGLQVGVPQPLLDDQGVLSRLREAGGAGVAEHVGYELGIVFTLHLHPELVPKTSEPFGGTFGKELPGSTRQLHAVLDDRADGVYDGDGAGMSVLGFPERDRPKLKIYVAALKTPEFTAAASRVEQDEKRLSVLRVAELIDDADRLPLLFNRKEADAVASLRAAGHLGYPFEPAPLVGRRQHAGQRGELAVDGAAGVALLGKVVDVIVNPVGIDCIKLGAGAKEAHALLGVAYGVCPASLPVLPVGRDGAVQCGFQSP